VEVGQNPATEVYIRNQKKRFAEIGIQFTHLALDDRADEHMVLNHLRALNENPSVTGSW